MTTATEISAPGVSKGRYVLLERGIYDTWGGYYIAQDLWDRRIAEGRTDRARHRFVLGERVQEPGVPMEWHRREARCLTCDERRHVYWAVNIADLNDGWCIPRRTANRSARSTSNRRRWRWTR